MNHFLDIGANTGQTFTDFLCRDPKYDGWTVWCFEPSPRHLPELIKTAEQFKHRYQINICPFGIGGTTGVRKFHPKDDPRGDSFEHFLATDHVTNNLETGYSLMVATIDINQFLDSRIGQSDGVVIKLDCEGLEYEILDYLESGWKNISSILVEWHTIGSPHKTKEELMGKFTNIGAWTL